MPTILTGKNCVLLNPIQELIEIEASYIRHFSYVDKKSSIKEKIFYYRHVKDCRNLSKVIHHKKSMVALFGNFYSLI